jgi:hypothetical protein
VNDRWSASPATRPAAAAACHAGIRFSADSYYPRKRLRSGTVPSKRAPKREELATDQLDRSGKHAQLQRRMGKVDRHVQVVRARLAHLHSQAGHTSARAAVPQQPCRTAANVSRAC